MAQIHELIPKIMAEVGAVGKNARNPQQGYQYRAVDDVVAALNPVMAEHGVFVAPRVTDWAISQVSVGQKGTQMFHAVLAVEHKFYAPDGSFVETRTVGEATDTGDKAANKAMASAYKYALTETFAIPTSDAKDTEQNHPELSPRAEQTAPAAADPGEDYGF